MESLRKIRDKMKSLKKEYRDKFLEEIYKIGKKYHLHNVRWIIYEGDHYAALESYNINESFCSESGFSWQEEDERISKIKIHCKELNLDYEQLKEYQELKKAKENRKYRGYSEKEYRKISEELDMVFNAINRKDYLWMFPGNYEVEIRFNKNDYEVCIDSGKVQHND